MVWNHKVFRRNPRVLGAAIFFHFSQPTRDDAVLQASTPSLFCIMKSRLVNSAILCLVLCFCAEFQSNAQSVNPNLAFRLQTTLDSLVTLFSNTEGASAAVYCPGQGIWTGASGLSYQNHPVTPEMEFGIASNSKLFTSVVLLKLAENGLIDLDDPISQYIANYTNVNPSVTIRQLLNHTSGVSDPIFVAPMFDLILAEPEHVFTEAEVLSYLGSPLSAPGAAYNYSNVNYILASMVAQSASGAPIDQLIRSYILAPLNMDSTFYDIAEPEVGTIAHRWYNGVDYHDTSRVSLNTAGGAAGSIFSTSSEMVQWYNALFSGQVISAASLTELTNFGVTSNYGLGLSRQTFFSNETWGHGGRTLGYKSRMIYDPCRRTSVCGLCNSDPSAIDGITALLYKVLVDKLPHCAGSITGLSEVCAESIGITYSVPAIENATSYIWTLPNGATGTSSTNTITVDFGSNAASGTITVRGTGTYGPGAESSMEISINTIPTQVTYNGIYIIADVVAESYQWIDCNNGSQEILNENGQAYLPTSDGNYAVILSNGSCSDTSECVSVLTVSVNDYDSFVGSIYPNPVSGNSKLKTTRNLNDAQLAIYDSKGSKLQEFSHIFGSEIELKTQTLSNGIYYLKLIENGWHMSPIKFVVLGN